MNDFVIVGMSCCLKKGDRKNFLPFTTVNKCLKTHRHITDSRPSVGRLLADNIAKTCWPFVGRQLAVCRPTDDRQTTDSRLTGAVLHNYRKGCETRQLSKQQTKMPRSMLEGPRPCTIVCFGILHYA